MQGALADKTDKTSSARLQHYGNRSNHHCHNKQILFSLFLPAGNCIFKLGFWKNIGPVPFKTPWIKKKKLQLFPEIKYPVADVGLFWIARVLVSWWLIKYLDLSHNSGTFTDIFRLELVELNIYFQHFQPSVILIVPPPRTSDKWVLRQQPWPFGPHQYSELQVENKISFDFITAIWGCKFSPHSISFH